MESFFKLERSGILANQINYQIIKDNEILDPYTHRRKIIDGLKEIVIDLDLSIFNLLLSLDYFDIIHTRKQIIDYTQSKYIAIICLSLATKIIETHIYKYQDLIEYLEIGNFEHVQENFMKYELECVTHLNYHLLLPSAYVFLNEYYDRSEIYHHSMLAKILYYILLDDDSIKFYPSYIALCSIILTQLAIQEITSIDEILKIVNCNKSINYTSVPYTINENLYGIKYFFSKLTQLNIKFKIQFKTDILNLINVNCITNQQLNIYKPDYKIIDNSQAFNAKRVKLLSHRRTKVYLVSDDKHTHYAVKRFKCRNTENKDSKARDTDDYGLNITCLREIAVLRLLNNNDLFLKLYSIHFSKNRLYLVLEYIPENLDHYIANEYPSRCSQMRIFKQLLYACQYLHRHKIMHRDIKPSNILIDYQLKIKLIDFDWARQLSYDRSRYTKEPTHLSYRAIELYSGKTEYDARCDIWSCGAVLVELIRKRRLFDTQSEIVNLHKIAHIYGGETLKKLFNNQLIFEDKIFNQQDKFVNLAQEIGIPYCHDDHDLFYLMLGLLDPDPKSRLSIESCLNMKMFE